MFTVEWFFFCPDGITPNLGLTGPNNTIYIYICVCVCVCVLKFHFKTEFLPSNGCINTTLPMYLMDTDRTYREKLDGNCTKIILNKYWKQHSTKQ